MRAMILDAPAPTPQSQHVLLRVHACGICQTDLHIRVLRSVANLTRKDGEEFLALAPKIPIGTEVEPFPLTAASVALNALRSGKINGAAVLVINHE